MNISNFSKSLVFFLYNFNCFMVTHSICFAANWQTSIIFVILILNTRFFFSCQNTCCIKDQIVPSQMEKYDLKFDWPYVDRIIIKLIPFLSIPCFLFWLTVCFGIYCINTRQRINKQYPVPVIKHMISRTAIFCLNFSFWVMLNVGNPWIVDSNPV